MRMRPCGFLRGCALGLLLMLGGCGTWHYTINAPLDSYSETHGYRLANLKDDGNSDSLMMLVSFSGGGMRAAALSYGVLERLAAERITWEGGRQHHRRLLRAAPRPHFRGLRAAHRHPEAAGPAGIAHHFLFRDSAAAVAALRPQRHAAGVPR